MRESWKAILRCASGQNVKNILITGCPGLFQRELALAAAKKIICRGDGKEGCGCPSCSVAGQHPDISILEPAPGKRTITVEDAQSVKETLMLNPMYGKRRVLIVDGIDTCSAQVANCFLKVMEEDANVSVICLSYQEHVLDTIRSRSYDCFLKPYSRSEFDCWAEENDIHDTDFWFVASSGCPGIVEDISSDGGGKEPLEKIFRDVLDAARRRDMKTILQSLRMMKEKDAGSFFRKYRDHVPVLIMALRRQELKYPDEGSPERTARNVRLLSEDIPASRGGAYTQGDFLNLLIRCYGDQGALRKEGNDGALQ